MGERPAGKLGPVPVVDVLHRDFGRWLQATGASDAYVLSDRWKAPFVPPHPYLLSFGEIDLFFTASSGTAVPVSVAVAGVASSTPMHSCGPLRTGDALQAGHVNLEHDGHVDVVRSKGNRSRRLPVTTQVAGVLASCDQASRAHFTARETFFVSSTGNEVTPATVGKVFARIWDQAGLARPAGGRQPRPDDFRHHFAYACIERWMRQGKDVAAMLPYLSRYMGHATFDSTYYYIHTSPDFLDAYADITQDSQSLLPEVGFGSDATPQPAHRTCSAAPGTTCTPTCPGSGPCHRRRSRPTGSAWNASSVTSPRPSTSNVSTSASTTSTAST